jgi:hypothetical protein
MAGESKALGGASFVHLDELAMGRAERHRIDLILIHMKRRLRRRSRRIGLAHGRARDRGTTSAETARLAQYCAHASISRRRCSSAVPRR